MEYYEYRISEHKYNEDYLDWICGFANAQGELNFKEANEFLKKY
jgi:hypothetical protein